MHKAGKALKDAESAAEQGGGGVDVSRLAKRVSEHTLTWNKAQVSLKHAQQRLLEIQTKLPISTNKDVRDAQANLKSIQLERLAKQAALKDFESEPFSGTERAERNVNNQKAPFQLQSALLQTERRELDAEKHLAWLLHQKKQRDEETTPKMHDPISQVTSYSDPNERIHKSSTAHKTNENRLIIQEKLNDAQTVSEKAVRAQQHAEEQVKDAQRRQLTEIHVEHAKLHALHAEKAAFYADQRVKMYKEQMSSLGSREAVHATHVETQAVKGQQRQGIENALQEAANELKKTHMNTVMKRIWTPKSFCRQGFVFVTGVCVKGPFVYAKCEIGPEVAGKPTFITVQAGCGCNGRYVHSMMIGHLESESQTKNKAPQHCITEFQKNAEAARSKLFGWQPYTACAGIIDTACAKHDQIVLQRQAMSKRESTKLLTMTNPIINDSIADYKLTIKGALAREHELRKAIADPGVWMPSVDYYTIPYLCLKENGELAKGIPLGQCRMRCTSSRACKSFSYKPLDESCITSSNTLLYDDTFDCYLKKKLGFDEGPSSNGGSFHMIPGMKVQDEDGANRAPYSLAECQLDCVNAEDCGAVSYSSEKRVCIRSRGSVDYNEEYTYYEKQLTLTKETLFVPGAYDKQVIMERNEKAAQELSVINKLVTSKRVSQELAIKSLSTAHNVPEADALEMQRQEKERLASDVVLPMP